MPVGVGFTVTTLEAVHPPGAVYVIVVVPPSGAVPVTTPPPTGPGVTVAIAVLALLQVPPGVPSVSVIADPVHTADGPPIAGGEAFTVTTAVTVQPDPIEYEIVSWPGDTPHTTPVVGTTVAIESVLLLHVPPPKSLSAVLAPVHTVNEPAIGPGPGLTVTVVVVAQPDDTEYEIVTVPSVAPHTTPVVGTTVAVTGVALLHVPPGVASLSVMDEPGQTSVGPVIGSGTGTIVT